MYQKYRESTPLSTFFCKKKQVKAQKFSTLTVFACLKGLFLVKNTPFQDKMKGAAPKELHLYYIRTKYYSNRIAPSTIDSERISVVGNLKGG